MSPSLALGVLRERVLVPADIASPALPLVDARARLPVAAFTTAFLFVLTAGTFLPAVLVDFVAAAAFFAAGLPIS